MLKQIVLIFAAFQLCILAAYSNITNITVSSNLVVIAGDTKSAGRLFETAPHLLLPPGNPGRLLELIEKPGRFVIRIPRIEDGADRGYWAFRFVPSGIEATNQPLFFPVNSGEASRWQETFPEVKSKKGLQVQLLDDAIALGVKHAALNVNLSQMVDLHADPLSYRKKFGSKEIAFKRDFIRRLDEQISTLTAARAVVSLILLAYKSSDPEINKLMLHPNYSQASPNKLSAFNTRTQEGILYFTACIEFLAERYSNPDRANGRAVNFIVGNEVNSHWHWYNLGRTSMEEFTEDYLLALRWTHAAVRKYSSSSRVYVSLEHHWGMRYGGGDERQTFKGKEFIDRLAVRAKEGDDFDWHLAFHPYPENLFKADTWKDRSATDRADSPRITFKNIKVLADYFLRPELLYKGMPRRIILSEQGFHSDGTPGGEQLQAAAYCFAYNKIRSLDQIDSFIYHRHVDHRYEGGLNLGLWRRKPESTADPLSKKPIYEAFKAADTEDWPEFFKFALPIIGINSWDELK